MLAWNKKYKNFIRRAACKVINIFGYCLFCIAVVPLALFGMLNNIVESMSDYTFASEIKHIKIKAGDKYFYLESGTNWTKDEILDRLFDKRDGELLVRYNKEKDFFSPTPNYQIYISDGMEIKLKNLEGE